jgi:hypothetical protein
MRQLLCVPESEQMEIELVLDAIALGQVQPSRHSLREAANDDLELEEIYASVTHGEVIEDYPNAYPMPACLILGFTPLNEPIHSVWGYDETNRIARLVTVYRPDPNRWINWRIRR